MSISLHTGTKDHADSGASFSGVSINILSSCLFNTIVAMSLVSFRQFCKKIGSAYLTTDHNLKRELSAPITSIIARCRTGTSFIVIAIVALENNFARGFFKKNLRSQKRFFFF